jgi:hypothetical protein
VANEDQLRIGRSVAARLLMRRNTNMRIEINMQKIKPLPILFPLPFE